MAIQKNIERLIIVIGISFLLVAGIIFFTADKRTLVSIKNINSQFMLLCVVFFLLEYTFDAVRTKILVAGTGNKISLLECYKLVAFQTFFNIITPFSFGGQPFQIYILHKKNIPGGSATTVVFTKILFGALALIFIVIYGMLFHSSIFITIPTFKVMINITGVLFLFICAIFLLALYNPKPTTLIISFFFYCLWKLKITRHPRIFIRKIMKNIVFARNSFNGFIGNKFFYFITGFILSFLMTISLIIMILCIIWGFNIKLELFHGIAITATLIFLIYFMPTPGTSGLGEGLFYLLYREFIPNYLIGVVIFLWRFFSQYLYSFLGLLVIAEYGLEYLNKRKALE